MSDAATIREVCSRLDPGNDAHWTSQGLPRMDVLAAMGLPLERRELSEALPGFSRASLRKELESAPAPETTAPVVTETDHSALSHQHLVARAERQRAAHEWLAQGGFTLADLASVRSRLDQRIAARNRHSRRELG